jgi:signal transduction histidine kinase
MKKIKQKIANFYYNLSLQNTITVPFLLQIFIIVGLVGYFSWRNGEQAVKNVTVKLRNEVTAGVEEHLKSYLEKPHLIVKLKQTNSRLNQLDFADFQAVQQDLWSTIQLFNSVRAIYVGEETGKFIYLKQEAGKFYVKEILKVPKRKTYLLNNLGQREVLSKLENYDPRLRPWYLKTQKTQQNNWSDIYPFSEGELGITAAGFLKNSQGKIQGIVGVDLVLSGIADFLQGLKISENGQVFVLERNGYLVATSTGEKPFTYNQIAQKEERLLAIESQNKLIRETANYLIRNFSSFSAINHSELLDFKFKDNSRQLVQVVPYQDNLGLDWLIVVVIPETDFTAEIHDNTLNTIWLCLTALGVAIFVGIYTSRKIARPIASLSMLTTLVAESARTKKTGTDFYPVVKAKNTKELKLLAQSFNEMVIQLKTAFKDLENTNENLEKRVKQRTKALIEAKEAADTANQTKSIFLANMSHELRTPLHAILGFTQIALQDSTLKPQQRENLLTVKRSGEHLLTLINDVLAMSKLETGLVTIEEKPFDLHLLLENLGKVFSSRTISQHKNLHFIFDLAPSLPQYLQTDSAKLNQILFNLLENAIKFTNKGSVTLRVSTEKCRDNNFNITAANKNIFPCPTESLPLYLAFEIKDTGCGIVASELDYIFAPFSQTKSITEHKGTGLGLAISQQFVRLLGGEIKVNSIVGKGSIFKFQIPVKVINPSQGLVNVTPQKQKKYVDNFPLKTQLNLSISKPLTKAIDPSTLTTMSPEWIQKLRQAAIEVDADSISQLIQQIPPNQPDFARELTLMLKNFQYDEIIELTEIVSA